MSDQVQLGPASPFHIGAKPGETEQFTLDVRDSDEGRKEIDVFRFARYAVLGWIETSEIFPYYVLTPAGQRIYSECYRRWERMRWEDYGD
jgi:hypothetical protein